MLQQFENSPGPIDLISINFEHSSNEATLIARKPSVSV
jgi:hypothetical protein